VGRTSETKGTEVQKTKRSAKNERSTRKGCGDYRWKQRYWAGDGQTVCPGRGKAVAEIGKNVIAIQGDVSNLADLDRVFQTVEKSKGKIDILFANAGVVEPTPTQAVTPEHYDKTFGINARGVFFAVQKALPLLKEGGSIILTGSGAWQKGFPIYATYSGTKAALRSFVRTWTAEFASKGIRANVISPGPIETPILQGQFGENTDAMKEQFKTIIPMKRLGRPEEVAAAAVFLASDESSFITGIDLPVDGGAVAV
jgi:NAD(P)-dependent dehydrogenase (short-subunit alcohol dehydrogenase family)